ncbi:hypothetical protein QFC22_004991 [Naganishia vaughanmartiniae]|uniref:Uncharacterized protein n=1 Tax=Naganishia vaughanmartiniae TaxID=1424756 RepID=A0ACC2WXG8_9TREE|nr:hypothetical protein QFC22_004991 [Naganishia vaughanmartiniae]
MFDDPLKAEEVKPLRRQDYVSLAKSQELRRILALPRPEDPPYARPTTHVRSILSGLAAIKDLRAREQYLAQCLGLEEELHRVRGGMQGNKRNHHLQQSSTSGRGGRGGAQKAGPRSTTAPSHDFYLPDHTAPAKPTPHSDRKDQQEDEPHRKQRSSKPAAKEGSASMFIGVEEQEAMRAFAEVIRQALEGNSDGTGERGAKRKMEWDA